MSSTHVHRTLTSRSGNPTAAVTPLFDFDLTSAVRTDACILLTGRDDAVRALAYRIHRLSEWREGPFTIVDCGAPVELVERMLFEAFSERVPSQARTRRGGTLLLHNVGQLDRAAQRRLADRLAHLRGTNVADAARRVMASTADPLLPRVIDGSFDDQLYYRLNVIHLVIPGERTAEKPRSTHGPVRQYVVPRGSGYDAGRSAARPTLRG